MYHNTELCLSGLTLHDFCRAMRQIRYETTRNRRGYNHLTEIGTINCDPTVHTTRLISSDCACSKRYDGLRFPFIVRIVTNGIVSSRCRRRGESQCVAR